MGFSQHANPSQSVIPPPIALHLPVSRTYIYAVETSKLINQWNGLLLCHRQAILAILAELGRQSDHYLEGVVLCNCISLAKNSYNAGAAQVIVSFLKRPFQEGKSIASGILVADLREVCASSLATELEQVLQVIWDAFTKAQLVEIYLLDNPIGHLAIHVCRCLLNKPSLRRLSLCNVGLGKDGIEAVANILTSEEEDNGCIAKQMIKIHMNNNPMGPEGCVEFACILEKQKSLWMFNIHQIDLRKKGVTSLLQHLPLAYQMRKILA